MTRFMKRADWIKAEELIGGVGGEGERKCHSPVLRDSAGPEVFSGSMFFM